MDRALLLILLTTSIFCPTESRRVRGRSCLELKQKNIKSNGVYSITPCGSMPRKAIKVYCDMTTDGGGWTVIQRRDNVSEQINFTRPFDDYANGFGSVKQEFWLGNDAIHCLTSQLPTTVRFDLEDFEGKTAWAKYNTFSVADRDNLYQLQVTGYSGSAGDSFSNGRHNGMKFSTIDSDNDIWSGGSCSLIYKGGWWYDACHNVNLNGRYLYGAHSTYADGVNWRTWKGYYYSLKKTEMKIRGSGTLLPWTTEAPYMTTTFPVTGDNCTVSDQTYQHGESWNQHCRDLTCINGQLKSSLNTTCCQSGSSDYANGGIWHHFCQRFRCDNGTSQVFGKDPKCGNCHDRHCSQHGGFCTTSRASCDGKVKRRACKGRKCVCCIPRCTKGIAVPDY